MGPVACIAEAAPCAARPAAWKPDRWPQADRVAWARAQHAGDFLDEGGAAATWRPATCRSVVGAYGRWLAFLAETGQLDPALPPAACITPEAVGRYVETLREHCASVTRAGYLAWLSMMAQALAPERDWGWLRALQARLQRQAQASRDKRPRIVPARELLQLGLDLMQQAEANVSLPSDPLAAARDFRDGLMIALLATRPLRQRNFLGIEIGQQLQRQGEGYALVFAAVEMKNHRPLEVIVPSSLVPSLQRYLDHYRPLLLTLCKGGDPRQPPRPAGLWLWLSQWGTPMTAGGQRKALARHTMQRFGHLVNAHLFRDCVATSVAHDDPLHVRSTAQLLGHAGFETTERHYIVAQSHQAQRLHHDVIEARRKALRRLNIGKQKSGGVREDFQP